MSGSLTTRSDCGAACGVRRDAWPRPVLGANPTLVDVACGIVLKRFTGSALNAEESATSGTRYQAAVNRSTAVCLTSRSSGTHTAIP